MVWHSNLIHHEIPLGRFGWNPSGLAIDLLLDFAFRAKGPPTPSDLGIIPSSNDVRP